MTKLLSKELSEDTIESFESEHISEIDEIGKIFSFQSDKMFRYRQ